MLLVWLWLSGLCDRCGVSEAPRRAARSSLLAGAPGWATRRDSLQPSLNALGDCVLLAPTENPDTTSMRTVLLRVQE